ncbi:MAG: IS200/IS605 family transposase [Sphingobacteriaceae bacterium]|nr:IS200/IS605 family transposase [Sphingobacteriaceae bacterium]
MANTYTQTYIQIVFAVKGRQNLISPKNREELHKYITGIVQNRGHKLLAIFCMPDHVHILIGLKPSQSISDLVRDIKAVSSGWINEKRWVIGKFNWQEGYGAFSYSKKELPKVINYILNQEELHYKKKFKDEYIELLREMNVTFEEKYLFDWVE